jgi:hypothetical protein
MNKIYFLLTFLFTTNSSFAQLNKMLIAKLDSIYNDDQKYRIQIDSIMKKSGWESNEIHYLIRRMNETDSINVIKIKEIINTFGWLGADSIGKRGNSTLFLVIQHADQVTQEKYLPILREAVSHGKAKASNLALMEDRVLLGQGKKQIYGTQIGMDNQTQLYYVSPLEDPDNVDKRRAKVGLEPMADYVKDWEILWDIKQYKKDLPKFIEIEKLIIK